MKHTFTRVLAVLMATAMMLSGMVFVSADDAADAKAVVDAINNLAVYKQSYHNCDATTNEVGMDTAGNLNSGGTNRVLYLDNKTEGIGSIKTYKLASRTDDPEHCVGFRGTTLDASQFTTLEFDLYISDGMTVDASSAYAYAVLHSQRVNSVEESKLAKIDIKAALGQCVAGQWNHVVVTLPALNEGSEVAQVTLRAGKMMYGNHDQYLLFDDICFVKAKEVTYGSKAAVLALKAEYDALNDTAKGLVTNVETLNKYVADINAMDQTIAKFNADAEALATPTDLTLADYDAVAALNNAYNSLDADAKDACDADAVAKFQNAKETMDNLVDIAVEDFFGALNALPTVTDVTASDIDDIAAVKATYDALPDAVKALIAADVIESLDAYVAKAASLTKVQDVIDMIDALPTPSDVTATDADAVKAAKDAYDALTDDEKALVTNADKLEALLDALKPVDPVTPTPTDVTLGDVNADTKVDAGDALDVLKYAVGKIDLTDLQKQAADVNKDKKIDAGDALEILKKAVGKPACF